MTGWGERWAALAARGRTPRPVGNAPSRRALYEALTGGKVAAKDLTARVALSQPAVSQHLAALKAAGFVSA